MQPSHRLTLTSPHLIHLANRCCSALGCRNYQRDHINADSDELYDYDTLHRLDTFKRGTLSGLPNSPAITDDDRVREQTWPDMTDIGNWAKFYTKDSDGDYIRPYEDRTFNTTNEMTDINPSAINGGDPAAYVPGYDAAGNLTDMPTTDGSPGHEFVYDYRNRIIEVQDQNQSTVMKYCYDGLNRRVKKDLDSGTDILYIYDGWQVVEEREYDAGDTAWEARRQYVYGGQYIDEPLIFDKDTDSDGDCIDGGGSTRYFYCQQANYNVVALTNDTGTVVEKVAYDPYGEYTLTLDGSTGNTLLFQGRRWDSEADLYYFRNRSYSPVLGRFLQRDPIGYADGMNLYEFEGNCPTGSIDPMGERRLLDWEVPRFGNEVMTDVAVPYATVVMDDCLKNRARFYCGNQLSNDQGVTFIRKLGMKTATAPIEAWKLLSGNVAKNLAKKGAKEILRRLKDELKQKRLQEFQYSTGEKEGNGCYCLLAIVYDPSKKTFRGFIHGRVGKLKMKTKLVIDCCETDQFTFGFSGNAVFSEEKEWRLFGYTLFSTGGDLEDINLRF